MLKLRSLKIGTRLLIIVCTSIVATLLVGGFGLFELRENMLDDRKAKTKNLVDSAVSLVNHYYSLQAQGVLTKEEAQIEAKNAVGSMRYDDSNYFFIFDFTPIVVLHPVKPERIGNNVRDVRDGDGMLLYQEFIRTVRQSGEGFVNYTFEVPNSDRKRPKISFVKEFEPWGWIVATGIYVDDVNDVFFKSMVIMGSTALIILIAVVAVSLMIGRGITIPLFVISENMLRLSAGDHEIAVAYTDQQSEIGDLARSMDVFRSKTIEMENMRHEREEQERIAEEEKRAALKAMADNFEASVGQVVAQVIKASDDMHASANAMSDTAKNVGRRSAVVSKASREMSSNVGTVSAAAEQLSSSIREISSQVSQSSRIANGAVQTSEETHRKIELLADAAREIGEVVSLITSIAEQTNLLALNATIEAARAGDAGKGFAVVASEVKNLANQTAKATEDIRAQVEDIQAATGNAVSAITEISDTIRELDGSTTTISAAVEEQGSATQEIARNVEHAAVGTQDVSENISGVSEAANDAERLSSEVLALSEGLGEQARVLNQAVDDFLAQVRKN